MSNPQRADFLRCYDKHRVMGQLDWYRSRSAEYERADNRAVLIGEILVWAAALCGIVGGLSSDARVSLGIAATALAAANIALSQWGDLIGFKPNMDLYRAAEAALALLHPMRPDPETVVTDEQVRAYIQEVENILLGEVSSWAQTWGSQAPANDGRPAAGGGGESAEAGAGE